MANSNTLKIIGTAETSEPLEMGIDIVIAARMGIVSIEKRDEMDGNFTYCHKGKLTHIELVNKLGKTVKGTAKGSKSQKLRWKIMEHGDNELYEKAMDKIIDNIEDILNKYVS